jgi:hypothetical protein
VIKSPIPHYFLFFFSFFLLACCGNHKVIGNTLVLKIFIFNFANIKMMKKKIHFIIMIFLCFAEYMKIIIFISIYSKNCRFIETGKDFENTVFFFIFYSNIDDDQIKKKVQQR